MTDEQIIKRRHRNARAAFISGKIDAAEFIRCLRNKQHIAGGRLWQSPFWRRRPVKVIWT